VLATTVGSGLTHFQTFLTGGEAGITDSTYLGAGIPGRQIYLLKYSRGCKSLDVENRTILIYESTEGAEYRCWGLFVVGIWILTLALVA
jgi:hypothetical protein